MGTLAPLAAYFNVSVEQLRFTQLKAEEQPEILIPSLFLQADLPTTVRSMSPLADIRKRFIGNLPKTLTDNTEKSAAPGQSGYKFAYVSEKTVADVSVLRVRASSSDPNTKGSVALPGTVLSTMWRMSSARLLTREQLPNREYYVFLSMAYDEPELPRPLRTVLRLTAEANLHGIHLVQSGPEDAAGFITQLEAGKIRGFSLSDRIEPEDDFDLL